MTIKEMSEKFNISKSSVYDKFKRHKNKELAGHYTDEKGENIELDDFAVNFLRPAKPQIAFLTEENARLSDENEKLLKKIKEQEKEINSLSVDNNFKDQFYNMDRKKFMEHIEKLTGDARINDELIAELTSAKSELIAKVDALEKRLKRLRRSGTNSKPRPTNRLGK